jgi:CRISPR-associated protein Cmr2
VSEVYWQAKIWGLLHDPALKALHTNTGRGGNSFWSDLAVMQDWRENEWNPETSGGTLLKQIHLADYIASASDRSAIGSISTSVNYAPSSNCNRGLEISHLLSGAKQDFKLNDLHHKQLLQASSRAKYLELIEQELFNLQIIDPIDNQLKAVRQVQEPRKLLWWLWRCLPTAVCGAFGNDESLLLMPAETRIPDSSIWSHNSLTAALSGALAGYDVTADEIKRWTSGKALSHAYLATFSFTPIQELIKASRKMRDLWAGSWILHYLSAKVCWAIAWKYGPDCLLYPSLFQQPLIDHWLLEKWSDFQPWINQPSERQLLTAGFPNVLVLILPKDKVRAAMQMAEETLRTEWLKLGSLVFQELQEQRHWMPGLTEDSKTWKSWLQSQWQTYWSALPIGKEGEALKSAAIPASRELEFQSWVDAQNRAYRVGEPQKLFHEGELDFLRQAYEYRLETQGRKFSVNVGSWWSHVFDQTRLALTAIKNARTWQLPTAFDVRSTVSGLGSAVHPGSDWMSEKEIKKLWQHHAGLFDGNEQLNATETLKRGLHLTIPNLLSLDKSEVNASYPDQTAGVAGYLKTSDRTHLDYFCRVGRAVRQELPNKEKVIPKVNEKWGIPWIDSNEDPDYKYYHPRLLNPGWLVEDLETREEVIEIEQRIKAIQQQKNLEIEPATSSQQNRKLEQLNEDLLEIKKQYRLNVQRVLDKHYPSNNPTDWYVLAAGDGDGMNKWLKGNKLENYRQYVPSSLSTPERVQKSFENFLEQPKRMGPSTHSALSRALLDFSNQLVPYLTEQRYAGRLIYSGGDDVLAYTNLWEWDNWLWDIRQCFRGAEDPKQQREFNSQGDYWQWLGNETQPPVAKRPLFTMGCKATISFGIVIAHHSVPLAITLENLRQAEDEAKEHYSPDAEQPEKDAVQIRVLYSNGNILKATAKFDVFNQWRSLLNFKFILKNAQENSEVSLVSALFEQAAYVWSQHPAPVSEAIDAWIQAFCNRRHIFNGQDNAKVEFQLYLKKFLTVLWQTTQKQDCDLEIQNWMKLAAFILRNRQIKLGGV